MASFNHTIVHSTDQRRSAEFLAHILSLPAPVPFSHFLGVRLANGVALDFSTHPGPIARQHYAFEVSDEEFDSAFERIRASGRYWADPGKTQVGEINHWNGGRGCYFEDPDGHLLEILTRP
jgi:catechol 2,3-dioxygenase-like lactoylglutathione lyase family enzyme